MKLDETQQKQVAQWAADGLKLSDIQKRIKDEFKLALTFLEARMLLLDMGIETKDQPSFSNPDLAKPATNQAASTQTAVPEAPLTDNAGPSGVSLEIDRIMQPGAMVSGSVKFSDGTKATWSLDQAGRLGINASKPGYRPSQADITAFQSELQKQLKGRGF